MKRKVYDKELRKLQIQLCQLQEWVKQKGLRIIILFEGRDAAGKGGTIKAITEKVSPRIFRTVALPALRIARNLKCTCSDTSSSFQRLAKS
jgi:polyphosphate kinase 2 (PPK2 family)